MGVECLRCGLVRIYCDFDALTVFRERGWEVDVDAASARFSCRCLSREVRLGPVPMFKRPRPIPVRPTPLRPIYQEDGRLLHRRGAWPRDPAIDAALTQLQAAAERPADAFVTDDLRAAIDHLRPHVYRVEMLDEFLRYGSNNDLLTGQSHMRTELLKIRRRLGRAG